MALEERTAPPPGPRGGGVMGPRAGAPAPMAMGGAEGEVSDEQAAEIEAQAARFADAAMVGVIGGDTPDDEPSMQVQQWIAEEAEQHQDPAEVLGRVAADVALQGNLKKGAELWPPSVVIGTMQIVDQMGDMFREEGIELDEPSEGRAMQVAAAELFELTKDVNTAGEIDAQGQGEPFWDPEELGGEALDLFGEGGAGLDRELADAGVTAEDAKALEGGAPAPQPGMAGAGPPQPGAM